MEAQERETTKEPDADILKAEQIKQVKKNGEALIKEVELNNQNIQNPQERRKVVGANRAEWLRTKSRRRPLLLRRTRLRAGIEPLAKPVRLWTPAGHRENHADLQCPLR